MHLVMSCHFLMTLSFLADFRGAEKKKISTLFQSFQHQMLTVPSHYYHVQSKTMERAVDAAIHSTLDGHDGIIVFLDLEKAFELAWWDVIISILASKGITGNFIAWSNDYLLQSPVSGTLFQLPSLWERHSTGRDPQSLPIQPTVGSSFHSKYYLNPPLHMRTISNSYPPSQQDLPEPNRPLV